MKALALALSLSFAGQEAKPIPKEHPCYLPEELMVGEEDELLALGWYNCYIEYDKLAVQHISLVHQKDMWKEMALTSPKPEEEPRFSLFGMPAWATAGVFLLTLGAGIGAGIGIGAAL